MSRSFLRMAIFCLFSFGNSAMADTSLVPVESYASLPKIGDPQVSPNGQNIAIKRPYDGRQTLFLYIPGHDQPFAYSSGDYADINWYEWASNERLIMSLGFPKKVGPWHGYYARTIAMDPDGTNIVGLRESRRSVTTWRGGRILSLLPEDPDHILMAIGGVAKRINIHNAKQESVVPPHEKIAGFLADGDGVVRLRWGFRDEKVRMDYRETGDERLIRGLLDENISVSVDAGDDDLWATVDRGQLETALINLAVNARESMPSGGSFSLVVSRSAGPQDKAAEIAHKRAFVRIEARDTGRGIPAEYIDQVFEPFFTTKDIGQGSGLGLSMVVGFAEQAGGFARIESKLGVGTSAFIYLPMVEQPAISDDAMPPLSLTAGKGEAILVVEDNPEVLTFMANSLRQRQYRVIEATDMNSAMDRLADQPEIGLLLTDVALPGNKSGADVAAWVQRQRPNTKVLYTSGYTRAIVEEDGRLPHGTNFLQKPFTVAELERSIRRTLDN